MVSPKLNYTLRLSTAHPSAPESTHMNRCVTRHLHTYEMHKRCLSLSLSKRRYEPVNQWPSYYEESRVVWTGLLHSSSVVWGKLVQHPENEKLSLSHIAVFWVITQYRLVGRYQLFGGSYSLYLQTWRMGNLSLQTLTTIYQAKNCHASADHNAHLFFSLALQPQWA
jgi:hypothetical protein